MHWAYVLGRAVGAALHELVTGFSKPSTPEVETTEMMTPDLLQDSFEGGVYNYVDDDTDWLGWAVPAISDVLAEHEWLRPHYGGTMKGNCDCMPDGPDEMYVSDWIDHVAPIVSERIACDPARAITALWNDQLRETKK